MAHEQSWRDLHPPKSLVGWVLMAVAGALLFVIGMQAIDANLEGESSRFVPSAWDSILRYGALILGVVLAMAGAAKLAKLAK